MAFVQSASKGRSANSHPNVDLASAPTEGNLLVAYVSQQATSSVLTVEAGWTALTVVGDGDTAQMFYKFAGASEGTNQQPCTTSHQNRAWVCLIAEYDSPDATPLDVEDAIGDSGSTKTSPTVNPASSGPVVVVGAAFSTASSTTYSGQQVNGSATGVTERQELGNGSGGNQTGAALWDRLDESAAASYATTVDASAAESGGIAIAVFKEAGTVSRDGSGTAVAPVGDAAGSADAPISGSGAATAAASSSVGDANVLITGSGSALASAAISAGTGDFSAGSVEGDGAALSLAGLASGSADVLVASSGVMTATPSTAVGSGETLVSVDGAATAMASVTASLGTVAVGATGAAQAPASTTAGAGSVVVEASGSVLAPAAMVSGSGNIGAQEVTGDGEVAAPLAISAGTAEIVIGGSGVATAPSGTTVGVGSVIITVSGVVTAAPGVSSGLGNVIVLGVGEVFAVAANVDGLGSAGGSVPQYPLAATLVESPDHQLSLARRSKWRADIRRVI